MPEEIVSRLLRVPGYGVYAWELEESTGTLWLSIRQTAATPYYVCGGCGISVPDVHSWRERTVRDRHAVLCVRRLRNLGPGRAQLEGADGPGSAVGDVASLVAGGGPSGPVSPLRGAHRAVALRDGEGAHHHAAGDRRRA